MEINKEIIDNSNMRSPIVNMEKPNDNRIEPITCPYGNPRANLYSLCIGCPDWPRHCNGPSLYEFLDIMLVRNFARKIRDYEKIKNKQIADKISHVVSEATVAEFFSNKVKDFMWTTTAYIFHGLKLVVLEKQIGANFDPNMVLDNPCPASSSKIQEMMLEKDSAIARLEAELRQVLELIDQKQREFEETISTERKKHQEEIEQVRQAEQGKVRHLLGQIEQDKILYDEQKNTADKRYGLIVDRDNQIAALQKTASRWRMAFIALLLVGAAIAVVLAMYIVWDFTHDGKGIFW